MGFDHIGATLELADRLQSAGFASDAELLRDRIRYAATGLEAVMGVRAALREIRVRVVSAEDGGAALVSGIDMILLNVMHY